jgi:hypothetical protein
MKGNEKRVTQASALASVALDTQGPNSFSVRTFLVARASRNEASLSVSLPGDTP